MKKIIITALLGASALMLAACDDPTPTSDQRERAATEQLANQAAVQVGVPGITNFTEKRQLKMLYELRDQANLVTYSYYLDINGGKHKVCPSTSIGFGLPYATQYTNPQKITGEYQHWLTMPQSEPNGLFMPSAAEGTWVMCLDPDGKKIDPTYVEPRVMVSLFPQKTVDN